MMSYSSNSSFQKKTRAVARIPGTKPSFRNNQLLSSSGVQTLDHVLGGGLAIGTVTLIEEDKFGNYAKVLLKYFLAEGVIVGHEIFVASSNRTDEKILKELPGPVNVDPVEMDSVQASDEKMNIAWRYQNLPTAKSNVNVSQGFGHYFDLTKLMPTELMSRTNVTIFDAIDSASVKTKSYECEETNNTVYDSLLNRIHSVIEEKGYETSREKPQQERNVLRIALHSLGSSLWGNCNNGGTDRDIQLFLYRLRALLRYSYAVCLITVPTHLFDDPSLVRRIERLCDTVVRLESFAGSDKEHNPTFKDYHGLFHIVRLPRLNSLTCHSLDSYDLAFKLKRKKFTIEKLHLPPELSETANRGQEDPLIPKCGSSTGKDKLDF